MNGFLFHQIRSILILKMKAFIYPVYGSVKDLVLADVPQPVPGKGEVLVKVGAASINDWDWGMMDGSSLFNRLFSGFRKPKYPIMGSDVAGVVVSLGEGVGQFKEGDRVYGDLSGRWGGFAEYVACPASMLVQMPEGMSYEDAAALPQAGMLAVQGLIDVGKVQPGEKILINGAGGGVGTIGLQILQDYGVHVTVVDLHEKLDTLRILGAEKGIDYTRQDFTAMDDRYDLILDTKTNRPLRKYLRVLAPKGRYVTVGGSLPRLFQLFVQQGFLPMFTDKRVRIVALKANKDLPFLNGLYNEGRLRPVLHGHFQFDELPKAMQIFADGLHRGKLVIRMS